MYTPAIMRFINNIFALLFFSYFITAIPVIDPSLQSSELRPTVTISSGIVIGTTTVYPDATGAANKFLGIPFAASPPERFSPPEPAEPWTKPLLALVPKPACIQQGVYPFPILEESEDCLYLNIFTPINTTPESKKAVMFWIYGGNLQAGSATVSIYDGSFLAGNEDVIVVTINYRVNIFGFPNSPALPTSQQNVGFMDQRLALRWVQENIAGFGGDPAQVTIFGQSAGGLSVENLIALPPDPLPFRAAIMQSSGLSAASNGQHNFASLATSLGCPWNADAGDQLQCVRNANATEIQRLIGSNSFPPIPDGQTFTNSITTFIFSRKAASVPFIIGNTFNDGTLVAYDLGLENDPLSSLLTYLETIIPGLSAVETILNTTLERNPAYDIVSALATNLVMQCPIAKLSTLAQTQGRPTWRYLYNASFPNSQQFPDAGAFHGSEVPEVFGTYTRENATVQQAQLGRYMSKAWAGFAKDPANGPGWHQAGGLNNWVGNIGGDGIGEEKTVRANDIDQLCPLLDLVIGAEWLAGRALG